MRLARATRHVRIYTSLRVCQRCHDSSARPRSLELGFDRHAASAYDAAMRAWTLVLCVGINFYLLGVTILLGAVIYPQFGVVERAAFPGLYEAFNSRIGAPVVAFEFLALASTLALYAWRPATAPIAAVHALTILGITYFAITFAWHLPSHRPIAAGDNAQALLRPLLRSQWTRTAVQLARTALLAWMSAR